MFSALGGQDRGDRIVAMVEVFSGKIFLAMSVAELKKIIQKKLSDIHDTDKLSEINRFIDEAGDEPFGNYPDEWKRRIEESLKQIEAGQYANHEAVMARAKEKWLKK
ncbi:MAG: hypothetical protein ACKVOR_08035 [Flavobacteriales bacterium]